MDYKLLSGALAHRMKNILLECIGSNQKGFLKGRFIGENTRLLYDIMEYLILKQKPGLALMVDFEKAFDSLEYKYIDKVLEKYNFGPIYRKWFNVLYNGTNSCVINNGHFSRFFALGRGSRQGDPWSPYLFILCAEPLAQSIINSQNITGIKIGTKIYKIGQYADDTFILLDGQHNSLREVMDTMQKFSKCSGLKINMDKTNAIWLGSKAGCEDKLCEDLNLTWTDSFTLLGLHFEAKLTNMTETNFVAKIGKVENILGFYSKLNLTLIGKICVIKTIIIPIFIHILTVLPTPTQTFIERLEKIIKQFLWKDGKVQISLEQLALDIGDGGLKLTKFNVLDKALKITWIEKLYSTSGDWQELCKHVMGETDKNQVWELDHKSLRKYAQTTKSSFWKNVIISWSDYTKNMEEMTSICKRPIWNSFFITNNNLKALKQKGVNKGCKLMVDLVNPFTSQFWSH